MLLSVKSIGLPWGLFLGGLPCPLSAPIAKTGLRNPHVTASSCCSSFSWLWMGMGIVLLFDWALRLQLTKTDV